MGESQVVGIMPAGAQHSSGRADCTGSDAGRGYTQTSNRAGARLTARVSCHPYLPH